MSWDSGILPDGAIFKLAICVNGEKVHLLAEISRDLSKTKLHQMVIASEKELTTNDWKYNRDTIDDTGALTQYLGEVPWEELPLYAGWKSHSKRYHELLGDVDDEHTGT